MAKPWQAQCHRKIFKQNFGKAVIGRFVHAIDAAKAFDAAMREFGGGEGLHMLNFPTPEEQELQPVRAGLAVAGDPSESNHWSMTATPSDPSSCTPRVLELATGDRIAFGFGTETNVHFGTVNEHESSDRKSNRRTDVHHSTWKVSFDTGEIYEMNRGDAIGGLELYDRILEHEKCHPLPSSSEAAPEIGNRTAFEFGGSGVHFGSIKDRLVRSGNENHSESEWTVVFDDGAVREFDSPQIDKSLALYRAIRERKEARLLRETSDDDKHENENDNDNKNENDNDNDTTPPTDAVATHRLLGMGPGDRIAYHFGTTDVYFGSIEVTSASLQAPRKDWTWDVAFDDGDRYIFDSFEMARGVALFEKIKQREQKDPSCQETIRKWKEDHLAEKQRVEASLPLRAKNRFLEVGFAKWGKSYLPVVFLGPYDVSPGFVREQWLEAFDKVGGERNSRHHKTTPHGKIPQIVYWFGVTPDRGFSILEEGSCLSLERAKEQGLLEKLPSKSKAAEKHNRLLEMLQEAVRKPPASRLPLGKVREVYEQVSGPKADRLLAEFEAAKKYR